MKSMTPFCIFPFIQHHYWFDVTWSGFVRLDSPCVQWNGHE